MGTISQLCAGGTVLELEACQLRKRLTTWFMKWGQHVSNLTINYFRPVSSVRVHPNDDVKEVLSGSLLRVKSRHVDPCFHSNMADVIWIYSHLIPHTSSFASIQSACYWELNHTHTFKIWFLFFVFGVDLVKSWCSFVVFGRRNLNVTRKKSKATLAYIVLKGEDVKVRFLASFVVVLIKNRLCIKRSCDVKNYGCNCDFMYMYIDI